MRGRDCVLLLCLMAVLAAEPPALAASGTSPGLSEQPALPASFNVVDSGHGDRFVARIQVDAAGRMVIEHADPHRREWFADIVAEINHQPSILLPGPPPSSAPRFAMYGVPIERNDPRFLSTMKLYLSRYYALTLR
jgi:hypothetical protein